MSGDLANIRKILTPKWTEDFANILTNMRVQVVGSDYRKDYNLWKTKNVGNMVQLVPEPGNSFDRGNAIAVYAAFNKSHFGVEESGYDWLHVGYVDKRQAKAIRQCLSDDGYDPNEVVAIARIRGKPNMVTPIELTGELRSF